MDSYRYMTGHKTKTGFMPLNFVRTFPVFDTVITENSQGLQYFYTEIIYYVYIDII